MSASGPVSSYVFPLCDKGSRKTTEATSATPGTDYAWNNAFGNDLVTADLSGDRIRVVGNVYDGDGEAVPDAMLEIWQADAQGRFADPQDTRGIPNSSFKGFGRCGTNANGGFTYQAPSVLPGSPFVPVLRNHTDLAGFNAAGGAVS